jgi:hypothetical protein
MKFLFRLFLFLSVAAGVCFAAFTLPWSTLDGGGGKSSGTSAGGTVFTVTGTIGQFDTTEAAGGAHRIAGGFWAHVINSPDPDYPDLTIVRQPNGDATIQWQGDAAGWQVQTSTDLVQWGNIGGVITTGGVLTVTYDPGVPKRFFRMKKP